MRQIKALRLAAAAFAAAVCACVLLCASALGAGQYALGSYLVAGDTPVAVTASPDSDAAVQRVPGGVYLNVIRISSGYGYTVYDGIYGWVDLSNEALRYQNALPRTVGTTIPGVKGLKLRRLPDKLVYTEDEDAADTTGLTVAVVFDDENATEYELRDGFTTVFPSLHGLGTKTVTVWYAGFSVSYDIEVIRQPVDRIGLTLPVKTVFAEGEPVSFEGLTVRAYYTDGRDRGLGKIIDLSDCVIVGAKEGQTDLSVGTHTVTVSYRYPDVTASFHIYVDPLNIVRLDIVRLPQTLRLYQGQAFKQEEIGVTATYDNGVTEEITGFDLEYDAAEPGTHTALIRYMGRFAMFEYEVLPLVETGLAVATGTGVGSYRGEPINFTGLTVLVVYNSGERRAVGSYELSYDIDTETAGLYPVRVTYGGFTATFDYIVANTRIRNIGDVDGDGQVQAKDARLALRYSARLETLPEEAVRAADVNADGKVLAWDARKILRVSAKLETFE